MTMPPSRDGGNAVEERAAIDQDIGGTAGIVIFCYF
jgi:hypothetical protein